MKLFTFTALALLTANTAAAKDGTGALRGPSLVTADLVYVAADDVDVDAASSNEKDDIANQAHIADEIEEKNDVSKYLRGIQLEGCKLSREDISCDIEPDLIPIICDALHPGYDNSSRCANTNPGQKEQLFCCK